MVGKWQHPLVGEASDSELLAAIEQGRDAIAKPVILFPLGEAEILRCLDLGDRLPAGVMLVTANPSAIRRCVDKDLSREIFEELGLPHPATVIVEERGELVDGLREVGLPAVVKPAISGKWHFEEKAVVIRERASLEHQLAFWEEEVPLIIQAQIVGRRHNVYYVARDGELMASAEVEVLRTDRWDGTGLAVEGRVMSETSGDLLSQSREIVRSINYTGVGCVQFLRDETSGTGFVLEVNPRLGANFGAVQDAGLDLAQLAVLFALDPDRATAHLDSDFRPKPLRYAWSGGDLAGLGVQLRAKRITPWVAMRWGLSAARTVVQARSHITWSPRDPMPSLAFLGHLMRGLMPSVPLGAPLRQLRRHARPRRQTA